MELEGDRKKGIDPSCDAVLDKVNKRAIIFCLSEDRSFIKKNFSNKNSFNFYNTMVTFDAPETKKKKKKINKLKTWWEKEELLVTSISFLPFLGEICTILATM